MDSLLDGIVGVPAVVELLAPPDPIIAASSLIEAVAGVDAASVTQAEIDSVRAVPEIGAVLAALSGTDTDGTQVTVATIRLRDTGDERVADAERTINELAAAAEGPLRVSSLSPAVIEDEYKEATESGMAPLIGLALLLIAALILLFLRTLSDLLLTLAGLILSIMWIVGAEGWLGPNGLGWIGPPSSLTVMVPIILISLTVDYAIQAVSHYRERRAEGETVTQAVQTGLHNVRDPARAGCRHDDGELPVDALLGRFRWSATSASSRALGVGLSLMVMLTLVPAGRTIIDRRRESRGRLATPRPVSSALPGIERAAQLLGAGIARRPVPYFVVVLGVTVWLRVLGHRAQVGVQHPRHSAQRRHRAGGHGHPRSGRRRLDGAGQRAGEGRGHGYPHGLGRGRPHGSLRGRTAPAAGRGGADGSIVRVAIARLDRRQRRARRQVRPRDGRPLRGGLRGGAA